MLTAFTARPIVELKARDKSRIESLVAYGDRLLVGLHTGVLRIYRVNEATEAEAAAAEAAEAAVTTAAATSAAVHADKGTPLPRRPADLLREVEKFSPRSIDQLAIIKEANTLVSLANYAVSLHDLQTFTPLPGAAPLPGTKNASCFAVTSNIVKDASTGIPEIVSRLAVAVKRRLLLWSWYASELSTGSVPGGDGGGGGGGAPEIILAETIRSLTWASATKLVVGMNAGYVLVDVVAQTVTDIVGSAAGAAGSGNANGTGTGSGNGNGSGETGSATSAAAARFGAAIGSAGMGYMGLGSYMPKPLAAKLAGDQVLLAKDVHTLFIAASGPPLAGRRPIPWPTAPDSIGYSYPYILALQAAAPARGLLEVRNPDTLTQLQTISLPGATQLHVPPPSVSLAHAGKHFHVSAERVIWTMDATSYDSQVAALVAAGQLDEAISLLGLLEDALLVRDKAGTLRAVKMQKAEQLMCARRYLAAMDLFNEEDVCAPPARVLRFFPRSLAGDLSGEADVDDEEDEEEEDEEEDEALAGPTAEGTAHSGSETSGTPGSLKTPEETIAESGAGHGESQAADDATNGHSKAAATAATATAPATSAMTAADMTATLSSGFSKMFLGRKAANAETASVVSWGSRGSRAKEASSSTEAVDSNTAATDKAATNGHVPLEGKELTSAAEALNSYLAGTRARLQRVIDPATGRIRPGKEEAARKAAAEMWEVTGEGEGEEGQKQAGQDGHGTDTDALEQRLREIFTLVDTTMFRVLLLIRPKLASSLFRIPNFCDPGVVNERLLQHNRYNELVDFFYGKKLHRQALELLRRFGAGEATKPETSTEGDAKGSKDSTEGSEDAIPPQLRGPQRTVAYLQSLPADMIDLVLEFSAWTLRADAALGMNVFLADSENAETLPRDRVAAFLGGIDAALELQYLEHIIGELNDLTPAFHNRLVEQRIAWLQAKEGEASGKDDDDSEKEDGHGGRRQWDAAMARLVDFLRNSQQYNQARALSLIPREDPLFYEAQAVVLSKRGKHKQALEIYVFKMKDYDKAEEYCNGVFQAHEAAAAAAPALPSAPRPKPVPAKSPPVKARSLWNSSDVRESREENTDNTADSTGDSATTPSSSSPPSIYHTLLSLYLQPKEPLLGPALDLLSRHGARLPASSTLQLIPDSLLVAQLSSYFHGRIRAANSVTNQGRIERGLRQTALMAAQAELLLGSEVEVAEHGGIGGRNRRVVVSEERACGVCHKRLGGSVVAVLPDNTVVHYGCLNRGGGGGGGGGGEGGGGRRNW